MFERRSTDSTEHVYYLRQYLVSLFSGQDDLYRTVATGFIRKYRFSLKVNLRQPNHTHAPSVELGITQGTPRGGVLHCAPQLFRTFQDTHCRGISFFDYSAFKSFDLRASIRVAGMAHTMGQGEVHFLEPTLLCRPLRRTATRETLDLREYSGAQNGVNGNMAHCIIREDG